MTPRVHSQLSYPRTRARDPRRSPRGTRLTGGWFPDSRGLSLCLTPSHEAVRLSGVVGEGPLRTPAYISGGAGSLVWGGAASKVGLRPSSPRRGAVWRGVAPARAFGILGVFFMPDVRINRRDGAAEARRN